MYKTATFIVSLSLNIVIFILLGTLMLKQRKLGQHIETLGQKAAEGNLPFIINQSYEKLTQLTDDQDKLNQYYGKLFRQIDSTLQNVGLVRYNAFDEMGGNLSFSLALLNNQKDGLILTSINGRNTNRIYVKHLVAGVSSDHPLTAEETQAIKQALKSSREAIKEKRTSKTS